MLYQVYSIEAVLRVSRSALRVFYNPSHQSKLNQEIDQLEEKLVTSSREK